MGTIEVIGEIVVDLVDVDGTLRPVPGGSPANVAVAASRLGSSVQLRARFGHDALAARCRSHLARNGVGLDNAVAARQSATLALLEIRPDGSARYDFWRDGAADWQWSDAELATCPVPEAVALHTGSLASWTPPGDGAVLAAIRRAHASEQVAVCYDPNVRVALMGDPGQARQRVEQYVASAHIVKASDDDVAWLYPAVPLDAVLTRWHALGVVLAVLTHGGAGSTASLPDGRIAGVNAPRVDVVDTVGAGDTFTGALLNALDRRGLLGPDPAARLATVTQSDLEDVLVWATSAAAIACTRDGCDPPSLAAVARLAQDPEAVRPV